MAKRPNYGGEKRQKELQKQKKKKEKAERKRLRREEPADDQGARSEQQGSDVDGS